MLNPRIYRAGFVPVVLAIIIAAFSLGDQPTALTTTLVPDAFNADRATTTLQALAAQVPRRRAGSAGDLALARIVRGAFAARDTAGRPSFAVHTRHFTAQTAEGERDLQTVVAERAGLSARRVVVIAVRDSRSAPATAQLSATATLLELAQVFSGRQVGRTLDLVSTSGGPAGVADYVAHAPADVDAVLVLGDVAGVKLRKPLVVPWSGGGGLAPIRLRKTVEAALRTETGGDPGSTRSVAQFARLAVPLATGAQGPVAGEGLAGVLLSASGELGPGAETTVSSARLGAFGRAVLRSLSALDADRAHATAAPTRDIRFGKGKLLPGWAVRLLVGALIIPVLFALIDALARVRRRRQPVTMWLRWVGCGLLPFVLAVLYARLLALTGGLRVHPSFALPGGAVPLDGRGIAALVSVGVVLVIGWAGVRWLLLRALGVHGSPGSAGAATAVMLCLTALTILLWVFNPYAAALLILPLHLWLFALAPEVRLPTPVLVAGVLAGLIPALAVAAYDASAFGWSLTGLLWNGLLAVAGGAIGLPAALGWACALGLTICAIVVALRKERAIRDAEPDITVRGPVGYAGPGSLGGVESALRR